MKQFGITAFNFRYRNDSLMDGADMNISPIPEWESNTELSVSSALFPIPVMIPIPVINTRFSINKPYTFLLVVIYSASVRME